MPFPISASPLVRFLVRLHRACGVSRGLLALVITMSIGPDPGAAAPESTKHRELVPYDGPVPDLYSEPDGFIRGSTWVFNETPGASQEADLRDRLTVNFRRMRELFGLNAVGVYDIVHLPDSDRDHFFAQLRQNRQKAVVRIERYDENAFRFDPVTDVAQVLGHYASDDPAGGHTSLLDYLIAGKHLDQVAYFAINMPVDDQKVAAHFAAGRGDPAWASSQVAYAREIVRRLREKLGADAKLYLSVFYGWDNAYPTPSYADCGADGYFINNYCYPDAEIPDENADPSRLLNQPRLQVGVDRFIAQYGGAPVVLEYGFHTLEFNRYLPMNQTAGLVKNLAAKQKALAAACAFYRTAAASGSHGSEAGRTLNFRGVLYFAQNLYKEEGVPAAVCDWVLDYPQTGRIEAEDPLLTLGRGTATVTADPSASASAMVALRDEGAGLAFFNLRAGRKLSIRYACAEAAALDLYVNGVFRRRVSFPGSSTWQDLVIDADLPVFGSIELRRSGTGGPVAIDCIDAALK